MSRQPTVTSAPTVRMRALSTPKPTPAKPTLRTALRDLERSLFAAFESAQRDQFER